MTDLRAEDRDGLGIGEEAETFLSFRHAVEAFGTANLRRASGLIGAFLSRAGAHLERKDPLLPEERRRVIYGLFHEGRRARPFVARFVSLMSLSVAIAVLGILADSTAVVIGAMLVAPLMGPVLGVAASVVMGWPRRISQQFTLVLIGALLAVGLATLISLAVPGSAYPLPAELIARTSPNMLDLGVALAAGAVGAYGQVRQSASDALPGVAVAVALVPPLAVVGVTLQLGEWQMALGATLLFLVNVAGIVVSASLTFIAAGFVPGRRLLGGNASIASGLRWASFAVILVVLPLQFGRGNVLPPTDQTAAATEAVEDFVDETSSEVVNVTVAVAEGVTDVDVVLATSNYGPSVTLLARHLAETLRSPIDLSVQIVETETQKAAVSP
ncbi:MAG: DUF389 domain-containing protein [Acidimicrobiia bacterium]|nr:DUF389 domain-containing protein [Acidimicrobiia bacterium]NNF09458.1 DUF389 domain-containing protein [Acidimicrobiia bacterium]NNL69169.1 DUF389 domain-containing protein [Acidimicrobiia bacterium]